MERSVLPRSVFDTSIKMYVFTISTRSHFHDRANVESFSDQEAFEYLYCIKYDSKLNYEQSMSWIYRLLENGFKHNSILESIEQ